MHFIMQKALAFWQRIMHNSAMRTHDKIVSDIGAQVLADLTGASIHTVRSWGQRKSIPAEYWAKLVSKGYCTADELMAAAAAKKAA
jgi:hypothetical protein